VRNVTINLPALQKNTLRRTSGKISFLKVHAARFSEVFSHLPDATGRVRQKILTIWQHGCEWNRWRGEVVLEHPYSETQNISVAMERWSVEHGAFAVETYFKNDSVVVTQRIFRRHFNIYRNDSVPSRNTVLLWVRNFRETASAAKRKPPGREPSLRTPDNIERVRQAFVRSPRRSASRNAIALRMSDRTVRRILHEGLNFPPYKMVMVQAINDQDTVNRKTVCEALFNALHNDDFNHVLMTDEANFHFCGNVNSQNCRYWATEKPRDILQQLLRSEKVTVWCGVASFGVILL
jgi:transposase